MTKRRTKRRPGPEHDGDDDEEWGRSSSMMPPTRCDPETPSSTSDKRGDQAEPVVNDESRPGAYRVRRSGQEELEEEDDDSMIPVNSAPASRGTISAEPVPAEESLPERVAELVRRHLQSQTAVAAAVRSEDRDVARPSGKDGVPDEARSSSKWKWVLGASMIVILIGAVVGGVLGTRGGGGGEDSTSEENITGSENEGDGEVGNEGDFGSDSNKTENDQAIISNLIRPWLFNSTLDAIDNDPASPQARAFDFLVNDTHLDFSANSNLLRDQLLERFAVVTLVYAWNAEAWADDVLGSDGECDWFDNANEKSNIVCSFHSDERRRRVTELIFEDIPGLKGQMPPEISLLTNLIHIDIVTTNLEGSIPTEIGALTELTFLELHGSFLKGTIPTQIGSLTLLAELVLDSNELVGVVPAELANLAELRVLSMNRNKLTGAIPEVLYTSLVALQQLDFFGNRLEGSLPAAFGNLTNVYRIDLEDNRLLGRVPTEVGRLTRLGDFWLSTNRFTGRLPSEIGLLTQLSVLQLHSNAFTGEVPSTFANLTRISQATLQGNDLTGSLDEAFCNSILADLEVLVADCADATTDVVCSCCTICCNEL